VVSVNLSSRQFLWQHDLVEMLDERACRTAAWSPGEALDLELTESVVMHNVEGAIATMNKLHSMGVSLSLDDFGTGYSSMQYLKQFPIDVLKVDQSFVRGIPGPPRGYRHRQVHHLHGAHPEAEGGGRRRGVLRPSVIFWRPMAATCARVILFSRPVALQDFCDFIRVKGQDLECK
jgi:hypothetical protein